MNSKNHPMLFTIMFEAKNPNSELGCNLVESSRVNTEPSLSSTRLKNSNLELDSNLIELFFFKCSKFDSKNN